MSGLSNGVKENPGLASLTKIMVWGGRVIEILYQFSLLKRVFLFIPIDGVF